MATTNTATRVFIPIIPGFYLSLHIITTLFKTCIIKVIILLIVSTLYGGKKEFL